MGTGFISVEIKRNENSNMQTIRTIILDKHGAGVGGAQVVGYSLRFSSLTIAQPKPVAPSTWPPMGSTALPGNPSDTGPWLHPRPDGSGAHGAQQPMF